MKFKIKKNDTVKVLAGKDRGKEGKVLRVPSERDRIIVEGVHTVKRRLASRRAGTKGSTVEKSMPIHVSNVLLVCSSCKRGVRTRTRIEGTTKTRVCVRCGQKI